MAEHSKIEWTDHTFNPWVGCTKVSPACDHCYAESWAKRSGSVQWGGDRRRTTDANWRQPLRWNAQAAAEGRRYRVFCASLADVFDNEVPDSWRADLLNLIADTPHLDWLLLTKRIGNARAMLDAYCQSDGHRGERWDGWRNVWLGATVCNQAEADRDIPKLLATPARVRFLSIEPMLGPVDIRFAFSDAGVIRCPRCMFGTNDLQHGPCPNDGALLRNDPGINWVIAGGESGPGARPMHPDWARSLRDQCAAAGVPFLFKQWGEWAPGSGFNLKPRGYVDHAGRSVNVEAGEDFPKGAESADGWAAVHRAGKKAAGRLLDGVEHNAFPE